MASRRQPKAAQGSKRRVEVSCVAWIDLLAYGSMLREAKFDPTDPRTTIAIERLESFHQVVAKHSSKHSPSIVMNDGAVIYRDLSPRAHSVTYDFLARTFHLHQEINKIEFSKELPGARAVLATGFRLRRRSRRQAELTTDIGDYLTKQVESGEMPIGKAIHMALRIKPLADVIPELQANFAFTKAYLADRDGSKAGLSGPRFYVDLCLFSDPPPKWLDIEKVIKWETPGISAKFGLLSAIDNQEAGMKRHEGTLDAFEIAERMTGSSEVIKRLQASRIKKK